MEEKPRKLKASGLPRFKTPWEKNQNFSEKLEEVPFEMSLEEAMDEASRCLQCPKPRCKSACPVNINIPAFIAEISKGDPKTALEKLKKQTALPAVCGRVCPQEKQCEGSCVLGIRGESVAIGTLERFSADYVRTNNLEQLPEKAPSTGKKVAIIGSGPAGITAAADLATMGHEVEIFEGFYLPGGVLMYGIPKFRLPKDIVFHEVDQLKKLGVKIHLNYLIGKDTNLDSLLENGFDAIFIASGVGIPIPLGIEGEDNEGVVSSKKFLADFNLNDKPTDIIKAKNIVTVGGGNVAMDASRTALRLGAKSTLVYRRALEQMPARKIEVDHAQKEGVDFQILTNPSKIITDKDGKMIAIECVKMQLGQPDESGRRSVTQIPDSKFEIPCDIVVVAIGNKPNDLIKNTSSKLLKTTNYGTLDIDEETLQTSIPQIFGGGDIVSGALTVISAMGQAKKASRSIDRYLKGLSLKDEETTPSL